MGNYLNKSNDSTADTRPLKKERHGRSAWLKNNDDHRDETDKDGDVGDADFTASLDLSETEQSDEEFNWDRLKVQNAGPAILEIAKSSCGQTSSLGFLFSEDYVVPIEPERISGVPSHIPAFIIHEVLTKEECIALIDTVPFSGAGYMSIDDVKQMYKERVVERYVSVDQEFSKLIEKRIRQFIPPEIDGLSYSGISPEWRYLHYQKDGYQAYHIDGREKRGNQISRLTTQMYLNDCDKNYSGGHIIFNISGSKFKYSPRAGDCLLFYQEVFTSKKSPLYLLHEAALVTGGDKYAVRSVVEYHTAS